MLSILLWIPEAIDDAGRGDSVLYTLIHPGLHVSQAVDVCLDDIDCVHKILPKAIDQKLDIAAGERDGRTLCTLRMSSWPFAASSPTFLCLMSLLI